MSWFEKAKEHLEKWKQQQNSAAEYWSVFTPRMGRVFVLAKEEAKHMND